MKYKIKAKYKVKTYNLHKTDEELLDDLRKTARKLRRKYITLHEYMASGSFNPATLTKRFGSWNDALRNAGLNINKYSAIPAVDLFSNLKKVWDALKRQPTIKEINSGISAYSVSGYTRRFGTWLNALKEFSLWQSASSGSEIAPLYRAGWKHRRKRKAGRKKLHVSKTMRFDILKRDNYKCRLCGASPATNPKVTLHIDHIIPRSKGGETKPKNLQTLCSDCNLGKGTKSLSS
jgi:hypothetical protein